MRPAYDAEQIRAAEAPLLASLPAGTLMQRASTALARRCAAVLGGCYGKRVVLLVGGGNNGGDALYAGSRLAARGAAVTAVLAVDVVHAEALAALRRARGRVVVAADPAAVRAIAAADLVVDGMLGIGGRGALREPLAGLAGQATAGPGVVVAVDVPSGVDASTGAVAGTAVQADVTVTFGARKPGLLVAPGASYAGQVEVVDIGLALPPARVVALDAADVAALLPEPGPDTDKYRRGVVGVVAGSDTYPGAAVLCVGGAIAAGAGMVRYAGPPRAADLVRRRWPEALVTVVEPGDTTAILDAGRVQAWVAGPGLGPGDATLATVRALLASDLPVVLDADAVTALADQPNLLSRAAPTLLTPHAGEFARLTGTGREQVEAARLPAVRAASERLGAVVLLKGSTTLVAAPDGAVRVNTAATAYLGTAGSGDVLSGVCAALAAAGLAPLDAGAAAAFLHGLAGLLATGEPAAPVHATQLIESIPAAIRTVRG